MRRALIIYLLALVAAQAAHAQPAPPGPGTSPTPGPANPTLQTQPPGLPKSVGSGSRGMTGNDPVATPGSPVPQLEDERGSPKEPIRR
jgi:hypothetical protein